MWLGRCQASVESGDPCGWLACWRGGEQFSKRMQDSDPANFFVKYDSEWDFVIGGFRCCLIHSSHQPDL